MADEKPEDKDNFDVGAALSAAEVREGQLPGADQLPEQQEDPCTSQGLRPPLQHGPGERAGDVDGDPARRQEEGEAREQGPVHQQALPPRRLRHFGSPESQVSPGVDPPFAGDPPQIGRRAASW
eukprot:CAMPEP_0113835632 /NCGR_PEP_ID=MMETSP0328-20130328/9045_1 /TAXON_ID=39455 /ORGANISM="Alexandrium minutum" /LENGTH=123 /DNA_ID=CAMNT_0000803983 /DNA_START=76 /DNA_END=443 /DNA_ORIENTATION=+ /assembly_acc=CAM_ASM_000350